jgi:hypothetical protein
MTENTYKEQNPCPDITKLQEKLTEKEPELNKTIPEEALKKIETLAQENAQLRERLKPIEKLYTRYDHLHGYMEKYGFVTDFEREMWQAIKQVMKE